MFAAGCRPCRRHPARNASSVLQAVDKAPPSGTATAAVLLQGAAEESIHFFPLEKWLHAIPLLAGMAVQAEDVISRVGARAHEPYLTRKCDPVVQEEAAAHKSALTPLHMYRKVLGVIGICHGPAVTDIGSAYRQFETRCR